MQALGRTAPSERMVRTFLMLIALLVVGAAVGYAPPAAAQGGETFVCSTFAQNPNLATVAIKFPGTDFQNRCGFQGTVFVQAPPQDFQKSCNVPNGFVFVRQEIDTANRCSSGSVRNFVFTIVRADHTVESCTVPPGFVTFGQFQEGNRCNPFGLAPVFLINRLQTGAQSCTVPPGFTHASSFQNFTARSCPGRTTFTLISGQDARAFGTPVCSVPAGFSGQFLGNRFGTCFGITGFSPMFRLQ